MNRLDVFVIGTNSRLYHKWWNGSRWSDWENLGGTLIAAPSAVSWGPNRIDTFALGTSSRLYRRYYGASPALVQQEPMSDAFAAAAITEMEAA